MWGSIQSHVGGSFKSCASVPDTRRRFDRARRVSRVRTGRATDVASVGHVPRIHRRGHDPPDPDAPLPRGGGRRCVPGRGHVQSDAELSADMGLLPEDVQ